MSFARRIRKLGASWSICGWRCRRKGFPFLSNPRTLDASRRAIGRDRRRSSSWGSVEVDRRSAARLMPSDCWHPLASICPQSPAD